MANAAGKAPQKSDSGSGNVILSLAGAIGLAVLALVAVRMRRRRG